MAQIKDLKLTDTLLTADETKGLVCTLETSTQAKLDAKLDRGEVVNLDDLEVYNLTAPNLSAHRIFVTCELDPGLQKTNMLYVTHEGVTTSGSAYPGGKYTFSSCQTDTDVVRFADIRGLGSGGADPVLESKVQGLDSRVSNLEGCSGEISRQIQSLNGLVDDTVGKVNNTASNLQAVCSNVTSVSNRLARAETSLQGKANTSDVANNHYTKGEVDHLLSEMSAGGTASENHYTKAEVDELIDGAKEATSAFEYITSGNLEAGAMDSMSDISFQYTTLGHVDIKGLAVKPDKIVLYRRSGTVSPTNVDMYLRILRRDANKGWYVAYQAADPVNHSSYDAGARIPHIMQHIAGDTYIPTTEKVLICYSTADDPTVKTFVGFSASVIKETPAAIATGQTSLPDLSSFTPGWNQALAMEMSYTAVTDVRYMDLFKMVTEFAPAEQPAAGSSQPVQGQWFVERLGVTGNDSVKIGLYADTGTVKNSNQVSIGWSAATTEGGVAVGRSSTGKAGGVAVGLSANAYGGVALGKEAVAGSNHVAIGVGVNANDGGPIIAIGSCKHPCSTLTVDQCGVLKVGGVAVVSSSCPTVKVDQSLCDISTNAISNKAVTVALNKKQKKLIAGDNVTIALDGTISVTLDDDSWPDHVHSACEVNMSDGQDLETAMAGKQGKLTAGTNITIDADGTIHAAGGGSGGTVVVDTSLSTTSANPVQNKVVTSALNAKQNKLTAGTNITIDTDGTIHAAGGGSGGSTTADTDLKNNSTNPIQNQWLGRRLGATASNSIQIGYNAKAGGWSDNVVGSAATETTNAGLQVAIGREANGTILGTAIGALSSAKAYGVSVGYCAFGVTNGVAIGYEAAGNLCGVAVGYQAKGASGTVAIGYGATASASTPIVIGAAKGSSTDASVQITVSKTGEMAVGGNAVAMQSALDALAARVAALEAKHT